MQRRSQRGVEHSGGRAGRVSLWSGKGSSARVESGTRLWRGSLEPLPIGIPRLQAGEDVKTDEEFRDVYIPYNELPEKMKAICDAHPGYDEWVDIKNAEESCPK